MMSTSAETYAVKLNYEGQMRRFPVAVGTSFKGLREQVLSVLALPKEADILLKYSDEEGDLITISSDLELNSAHAPGTLLRLTVIEKTNFGNVSYPPLDPMLHEVMPTAPLQGPDSFRSFGGPQQVPPPGFTPAPGFGGPQGPPPAGFAPAPDFAGPQAGPGAGAHGFSGHHRGGHCGPYRGGLGFRGFGPHASGGFGPHARGGFGPHARGGFGPHARGGFGHHGGFRGYGPYGHPANRADMSREEWQDFKKEQREMRKEMKREWKDSHKCMKKEWKHGRDFQCADGMQWGMAGANDRLVARFAKDVTIPDGTQLAPNTPFVKTWRLRNEGAAWPAGCVLQFLGKKSDKMGGSETVPLSVEAAVATNTEIDVSVNLVAPEKPGRYTGYWKLCTPDGRKFGQRVWASIVVPGSPSSSSSSSSDSDKEADKYEAMVDAVLATGLNVKRHRVFRMLQKTNGNVSLVCEKLAKKDEKKARKAMKKQMKI